MKVREYNGCRKKPSEVEALIKKRFQTNETSFFNVPQNPRITHRYQSV